MINLLTRLKISFTAFGLAVSSVASASSTTGGYAFNVTIAPDGYAWFGHTGTLVGSLPAGTDPNGPWLGNASAVQGQAQPSGLLTALVRHPRTEIQGAGTRAGGHELVQNLTLVGQ